MSERETPTPAPATQPAPAATPKPRRRRRWGRRLLILLLVLVLLGLALRVAVPLLAPTAARIAGRSFDLDIALADLSLNVTGGSGEVSGLVVRPAVPEGAEPAEPILRLDHASFDLDLRALAGGRLRVARVAVDGIALRVLRRADGRFEVEDHLPVGEPGAEPEPPAEEPGPLDLTLPIEIGALSVHGVSLRYRDETFDPPLEYALDASARVLGLGGEERPAELELLARSPGLLGLARVAGTVESAGPAHSARLGAELHRLRLAELEPLLARMGLRTSAAELAGSLRIELDAGPRAEGSEELRAELALVDLELREDGVETAALEEVRVVVEPLTSTSAAVALAQVRAGHLEAHLAADGAPGVAGIELGAPPGGVSAAPPAPEREPAPDQPERPPEPPAAPGFRFLGVERLALAGLALTVRNEAAPASEPLVVALEELELTGLGLGEGHGGEPAQLALEVGAPGVFERLRVDGPVDLAAPELGLELELALEGLRPERLEPWLAPLGVETTLQRGSVAGRLTGRWTLGEGGAGEGGLALEGLRLADGEELMALDRLALDDVAWIPAEERLRVGAVAVEGTRLAVLREASDAWRVAGLRLGVVPAPAPAAAAAGPPKGPPPAEPEAGAAPAESAEGAGEEGSEGADDAEVAPEARPSADGPPAEDEVQALLGGLTVELGRLSWSGARLQLVDEDPEQPLELLVTDVGIELEDLTVGSGIGGPAPPPARLALHFAAEGLADELRLEGTLQSEPGRGLDADLRVDGRGLTLAGVEPLLAELGLRSELAAAELGLRLQAGFRLAPAGFTAGIEVSELRFADGGAELVACDSFAVRGFALEGGRISVEEVALAAPRALIGRDESGGLRAAGLVLLAPDPPAEPPPPDPSAPNVQASPLEPLARALEAELSLPELRLGRLAVVDAALGWRDAAIQPAVETVLRARLALTGLELGAAAPAAFEAGIGVDGGLEELAVTGELRTDPRDLALTGTVSGAGLRAGPLAAYLPAGLALALEDGRLGLGFELGLAAAPEGGRALRAVATGLELAEGAAPLLRLERAAAVAERLDPSARVYTFGELTLLGLELDVRRTERGIEALGVVVAAGGAEEPAEAAPAEEPPPPAEGEGAVAAGEPQQVPWWSRIGLDAAALPEARLEALDVGLARLTFVDETRPDSQPLELSARVSTPGPQILIAPDPESLPPLELRFESALAPLVGTVASSFRFTPYEREPQLTLELVVGGIRGDGLVELAPELAETIDGSELTEGELRARLDGHLRWSRRGPTDFDLTRGFGGELLVEELAFRQTPDGEPLAGIDAIAVQLQRVRPVTGSVRIRSIDVERPFGHVRRDVEGIHLLGLTVKLPPPSAEPEPAPGEEPAVAGEAPAAGDDAPPAETETEGEVAQAEAPPAPPAAPSGTAELRIDRFRVTGIDFVVTDETVEPAFVYPLEDLDLTVDGMTTRMLEEPRAVVFSLELVSGSTELPEHFPPGSLLGGVLNVATSLVTRNGERPLEERPVFGSIYATGRLAAYPEPEGWLTLRVSDFELLPFRQIGAQSGVDIKDGLIDTRVQARLEDRVLKVETRTVMRSMSLSEKTGGPIASTLGLPAPLDSVMWALRNDAGEQVVPVNFEMEMGAGLSRGQILGAATNALRRVITDALTSAPKRVLSTVEDLPVLKQVTGFLGKIPGLKWLFGEDPALEYAGRAYPLHFPPGATTVAAFELHRMKPMLAAMAQSDSIGIVLVHELGGGDVARAAELVNPSPQDCRELAERLRQRKSELLRRRSQLSGELEALYAAGRVAAAEQPREALRLLDLELGETESALDGVFELLEPASDRKRARRAREGALAIARQRLGLVRDLLVDELGPKYESRIELRPPRYAHPEGEAGGTLTIRAARIK